MSKNAAEQRQGEPYVLFELNGTTYGIHSREVKQMEMLETITPVPNAPPFVRGVVFSRGEVIPAIDLRTRFGFPPASYDLRTRLIVAQTRGRAVGLIVDTAREFVSIPAEAIQPPPEAIAGLNGKYLNGIVMLGERIVLLLNVAQTISLPDMDLPESEPSITEERNNG